MRCAVVSPPTTTGKKGGQREFLQQLQGERFWFVGDYGHRNAGGLPGPQGFFHTRVTAGQGAVGERVMMTESGDATRQQCGIRWRSEGQAAFHQHGHALAYETADLIQAAAWQAKLLQHSLTGCAEIRQAVDQRAIEIESDGSELHALSILAVRVY